MKKQSGRLAFLTLFISSIFFIGINKNLSAQYTQLEIDGYHQLSIPDSAKLLIENATAKIHVTKPSEKRNIIVFNMHRRNGKFVIGHPSIPYSNYALQFMGNSTGTYEVTFSNDTMDFSAENLAKYDAVCFNNTAGVLFENKQLRQNLLDYVFSGGGFIGIHAAGATFCQWPKYDYFPEFGLMLGGFENGGHPWKPDEWINLKIDDPKHPVNKAFNEQNFEVSDEVFQFSEPYSRNRLRSLISIDTSKTDWKAERRILPERFADGDVTISWVKRYGKGRIFYTSLGHNAHLNWNPKVLQHYLDGIRFVTGDLEGATTPSAKITPAIRAQEKLGWNFGIAAYTFKNNTLFETIEKVDELGLAYVGGLNVQTVSKDIPKKLDYNLSVDEIQKIRDKLALHGITMLTYYIFDIPAEHETCRKIFEFGKNMGIETFISEPKPEDLDFVEEYCKKYNIKLAIHNHGPRLSPVYMYPENIVKLCNNRSPLIGSACDFGHWAKEGIDPWEAVQILGDRIITIQMHDQSEINSDGHDVPWGTGKVQLERILNFLKKEQILPVMFGLEYSYNWDQSMPEIKESIQYFNDQTIKLANQ